MPTTFNWIYLGTSATVLDPTEGNTLAENAADFETETFGSSAAPLFESVTRATMIDNGGFAGALDQDNNASNDQFTTDIGAGTQTFTFDGVATYDATLTYTDGTTTNILAIVLQDTDGNLYLAPPFNGNSDATALAARPIESVTLDTLVGSSFAGLGTDREEVGIDDGIVQGTSGDDLIDASYVEPVENGSDQIDNDDAPGGGDADSIEAGGGNDTVFAGLADDTVLGQGGNDQIFGGAGNDDLRGQGGSDTIFGEAGNDTLIGGAGSDSLGGGADDDLLSGNDGTDTLIGGAGNDTLGGLEGDDVLYGDAGPDNRWAYEVYTQDFSSANGQAFTIENGALAGSGTTDEFDVTGLGQQATGQTDPNDYGVIFTSNLVAAVDGLHRFETTSDDGSTIRIFDSNGDPLTFSNQTGGTATFLNNDFHQPPTTRWGDVTLEAGRSYTIEVRYWENQGGNVLSGEVTQPGGTAEDLAISPLITGIDAIEGDDLLDGSDGADLVFGEGGDDTIIAGENDTLYGGDGDDRFLLQTPDEAGIGTITIIGGEGDETDGDTLLLTPDIGQDDITFTNTDDANGGFSGSFTMPDGTVVTFSEIENIICFTPGTLILTEEGERPVESLRLGCRVITRDHGAQPLRWMGASRVVGTGSFAPIRVAPSLLEGARQPLIVSPQHRFVFGGYQSALYFGEDEVMAAATHLEDGIHAMRLPCPVVTYIHLMFDAHEVIFAEGAATESFHAGSMGLAAISEAAREDLFRAMPHLRGDITAHGPTARRCLKAHEARLLLPERTALSLVA